MSINGGALGENGSASESLDFRAENIKREAETKYFVKVKGAEAEKRRTERRVRFAKLKGALYGWRVGVRQSFARMPRLVKVFLWLFVVVLVGAGMGAGAFVALGNFNKTTEESTNETTVNEVKPDSLMTQEELREFENYEKARSVVMDAGGYDENKEFDERQRLFRGLLEDYEGNPDLRFFLRLRYVDFLLREGGDSEEALGVLDSIEEGELNKEKLDYYYAGYMSAYKFAGNVERAEEYEQKKG